MHTTSILPAELAAHVHDGGRLSDLAYDAIRQAIASGHIGPGERLLQEQLANEMGVSQVTVREALNRLVAEGLVEHEPYKGVRATVLPLEEQADIMEIRLHLEALAMESAAVHISQDDLSRMRALLPSTVMYEDGDAAWDAWLANRKFHRIAIESCGRPHLIRILGQVMDLTNHYLLVAKQDANYRAENSTLVLSEHQTLLDCLAAGDGKGARRITEENLTRSLHMVHQLMEGQDASCDEDSHR